MPKQVKNVMRRPFPSFPFLRTVKAIKVTIYNFPRHKQLYIGVHFLLATLQTILTKHLILEYFIIIKISYQKIGQEKKVSSRFSYDFLAKTIWQWRVGKSGQYIYGLIILFLLSFVQENWMHYLLLTLIV